MKKNALNYLVISIAVLIVFVSCDKELPFVAPGPIEPFFDYSSIVFIARITDNSADWSLCVMDKSGNNMQKIVDKTVGCRKPVRSHCGTKLLFTSVPSYPYDTWEVGLYIVNIDGTGLTLIDQNTRNFGGMDWSPDNRHIVYVKSLDPHNNNSELILYNVLTKTCTVLKTNGRVCSPKFSPDGRQIAYCTEIITDGDTLFMNYNHYHHIYKLDINGKNNRLIISNAASPLWSPQGDKIAYSAAGVEGEAQIFVANADGSNQKQLTYTISPQRWPGPWLPDGNGDPQWSPDGNKIVYVSFENVKAEIFIMNADGSGQTRLTMAEFRDGDPEVTPDGKYILFSSRRSDMMNSEGGIIIMTLDGKNERVLHRTGIHPIVCK